MKTQASEDTVELSDLKKVELFVDPIQDELADQLTKAITLNKIFLSKVGGTDLEQLIVSKSTPLFRYHIDENENNEEPKNSIIDINPEFHSEDSNIIQSGQEYIAEKDGLFILENDKPRIIEVSLDGSCEVKVSEDVMQIIIDIYPSIGENSINTLEDIEQKILQMEVKSEINKPLLIKSLKEVEEEKKNILNLCIVEGKYAVDGINGRLENCTEKKEKIKNFDFDNFYKVNPVISVKENQVIAIIHPPTEGESGTNIIGQNIPPKPGKVFQIKLGKNTVFHEELEGHIVAKKDGFLSLSEESINITDTFTVRGDIDFESGNIIAKGSLKVNGNVKNDFSLNLTKSIEIGGYVGDALIESGGSVNIQGGFKGKGSGIIRADEDVFVKFVENQKIFSRGSLDIRKDALNAKLYVKNNISCKNHNSSIIGGHVVAGDKIEVFSLGNDARTETIVEVGFDYLKRNSITSNKEQLILLREKLENVDQCILELARMKRMSSNNKEQLQIYAAEHKRLAAEIENIKTLNLKITNEIYVPTLSKISVQGYVYPGVKIGINGRFLSIDSIMKSKTFILSNDNEIISTHLS